MKSNIVVEERQLNSKQRLNFMVKIAMLGAISVVFMLFEVPLPFIAPPFYKIDLSEVPVLIGAFAMGPLVGVIIEVIKIILNFIINGTITAGVGEMANFVIGCALIIPASIFYRLNKTKKNAYVGMLIGTLIMAILGCFLNAFVLLPVYAKAFNMPMQAFVDMGKAINPAVNGVFSFVLLTVFPFNIIKGITATIIVGLVYKRISPLLHK